MWSSQFTENMIWILKVLDYYQLIGGVDFALSIYTGAQMLDLEAIPIKADLERYLRLLRIPNIFEELEASFFQRNDENYAPNDTFPQYEIFENFADWEIKGGFCIKNPSTRTSQCVQRTLQYLRTFSSPWDYQSLSF